MDPRNYISEQFTSPKDPSKEHFAQIARAMNYKIMCFFNPCLMNSLNTII